ncbi:transmembrane protein 72 [Engraulis encrasicolus]|uniref:transmembrane protein 72 n=1 Tax=Engraulis encrasicolus TaxID=184585 RepID=UPI002FD3DB66
MGTLESLWGAVECACRVMGICTAAVLCGVGIETLGLGEHHSLAVYLLVSSAGMMLFEMAFFVDTLLEICLPCPPDCKAMVLWKRMAHVSSFQKFMYYTMMSLLCFLHPLMLWHALIPGCMLLATGLLNFLLSKRKKAEPDGGPSSEATHTYCDPSRTDTALTEEGSTEQTFSFFHVIMGSRPTLSLSPRGFLPSNSRLQAPPPTVCADLQAQPSPSPRTRSSGSRRGFGSSGRGGCFGGPLTEEGAQETEMEEYVYVDSETTSDKAPMIPP